MSSPAIRLAIMTEVSSRAQAQGVNDVFNLSDYVSITELPVNTTQECIVVNFVAANDRMVTVGGDGNQGWEETGTVGIHWLVPTGFDSDPVLQRCEALRLSLRGRRFGKIYIEEVEPFMDSGSPVDLTGWTGFSSYLAYTRNTCG